jgi:hypothetical protein
MGHNTSFLTRVACNALHIMNDLVTTQKGNLYAAEVPESSSTLSSCTSDAFTDPFFKRF